MVAGAPSRRAAMWVARAGLGLALIGSPLGARAADPWAKELTRRGIDPALLENPVAVTPEIKAAADRLSGGVGGTVDELRRIQSALFDTQHFTFDYDATMTETAAEALARGRGNCVAFTNLFIAMARARGLSVKAGYVTPRVSGVKRGDLVYVSTHVVAVYPLHDRFVVFDFYMTRDESPQHIRLLDDFELAALYLNNRAVEALTAGDFALAEARLDAVLKLAPHFAAAHGNLGVILRRRGNINGALDAYRRALELDPREPSVLSNLASLYNGIGLNREAKAALALADMSRATVFTVLAKGDLEAADGRVDAAFRYYRRAARNDPKLADPQISIARLARATGRWDDARRAAERALKLDPDNVEARAILDAVPDGAH